jgi:hypothetical protein
LSEEAMTTKRWAAAARIFSRVCAAPPPLISQPVESIWSAPSIARSSLPAASSERTRSPFAAAARSLAGDAATKTASGRASASTSMSRLTVEPLPSPTTIPGSISRAASRAGR